MNLHTLRAFHSFSSMQNKAVFYFHFDIFETKAARKKNAITQAICIAAVECPLH